MSPRVGLLPGTISLSFLRNTITYYVSIMKSVRVYGHSRFEGSVATVVEHGAALPHTRAVGASLPRRHVLHHGVAVLPPLFLLLALARGEHSRARFDVDHPFAQLLECFPASSRRYLRE